MKSRIVMFVVLMALWTLLSWPPDAQHAVVGVVVSLVVAVLAGGMFVSRPHAFGHVSRYAWFLYFIPVFVWECLKANLDVAYRVLHPGLPIKPGIVKVKTTLKSDVGLAFLANAITLTPGTMTVDIDGEKGLLYIHCIFVGSQDIEEASRRIAGRFEKVLANIFD